MSNTLQLAILSMDAYNRGDVDTVGIVMPTQYIAGAKVEYNSSDRSSIYNGNFSATTYLINNGSNEYIISYRGTDAPFGDLYSGFGEGGGFFTPQAVDSILYYKNTLNDIRVDSDNSYMPLVTVTGHSLGGGLAGLVSSLYGLNSVIFNNMPFQLSAQKAYEFATSGGEYLNGSSSRIFRRFIYGNGPIPSLQYDKPIAFSNPHDFLGLLRFDQTPPVQDLPTGDGPWSSSPILGHSMALEVALVYAATNNLSEWLPASKYMWTAFDSAIVASEVENLTDFLGTSDAANGLKTLIAYSAVDPTLSVDNKPFGDTAIASMFDDAADMALAVKDPSNQAYNSAFQRSAQDIADLFVLYAGNLAAARLNKSDNPELIKGILATGENNDILTVNISSDKWTFAEGSLPEEFRRKLIEDSLGSESRVDEFKKLLLDYNSSNMEYENISSVAYQTFLGRIGNAAELPAGTIDLLFLADDGIGADTTEAPATTIRSIVAADNGQLLVGHDEDDLFLGGNGVDKLYGGGGVDVLYGGAGNDWIYTQGGVDKVDGGSGNDVTVSDEGMVDIKFYGGAGYDVVETASGSGSYNLDLSTLNPDDISLIAGGEDLYGGFSYSSRTIAFQWIAIKINATGETITFYNKDRQIGSVANPTDLESGISYAVANSAISSVKFASGIVWDSAVLWDKVDNRNNEESVSWDLMFRGEGERVFYTRVKETNEQNYDAHLNATYLRANPLQNSSALSSGIAVADDDFTSQEPLLRAAQLASAIGAFDQSRLWVGDFGADHGDVSFRPEAFMVGARGYLERNLAFA